MHKADTSPLYTDFTGNKHKHKCPELSGTWFGISYYTTHFCRLGNSIDKMKINFSRGNDKYKKKS